MLKEYLPIGLNIAAGIFICQAVYSYLTDPATSIYLEQFQAGLLFCVLAYCAKIYDKNGE